MTHSCELSFSRLSSATPSGLFASFCARAKCPASTYEAKALSQLSVAKKAKALLDFLDHTSHRKLNRTQALQVRRAVTPMPSSNNERCI
jgi:hypothetical protein